MNRIFPFLLSAALIGACGTEETMEGCLTATLECTTGEASADPEVTICNGWAAIPQPFCGGFAAAAELSQLGYPKPQEAFLAVWVVTPHPDFGFYASGDRNAHANLDELVEATIEAAIDDDNADASDAAQRLQQALAELWLYQCRTLRHANPFTGASCDGLTAYDLLTQQESKHHCLPAAELSAPVNDIETLMVGMLANATADNAVAVKATVNALQAAFYAGEPGEDGCDEDRMALLTGNTLTQARLRALAWEEDDRLYGALGTLHSAMARHGLMVTQDIPCVKLAQRDTIATAIDKVRDLRAEILAAGDEALANELDAAFNASFEHLPGSCQGQGRLAHGGWGAFWYLQGVLGLCMEYDGYPLAADAVEELANISGIVPLNELVIGNN